MKLAVARLRGGRNERLLSGHPWIYAAEVDSVAGDFQPGDVLDIEDSRGRFVGRGYINPASQILIRILTRKKEDIDEAFFMRRIESAWSLRQKVIRNTNACRVVFTEADYLPGLVVDKFGQYLVIQTLTLGMDRRLDTITRILQEVLDPKGMYQRNDVAVRKLEGLPLKADFIGEQFDPNVEIEENGYKFEVDLAGGQKTGYFLDQRENRMALGNLAGSGCRVLDCFCHTGTFSIYAAGTGAGEVTGLDISGPALRIAERNALRNGFERICRFTEANCFDELRAMERAGEKYDLVILDPPAFTRSKSAIGGAVRGYKEINLRAVKLLKPGGFLVTCSCSYHMSGDLFMRVVNEAAQDAGREIKLVQARRQAKDHPMLLGAPETYYLKCLILQAV